MLARCSTTMTPAIPARTTISTRVPTSESVRASTVIATSSSTDDSSAPVSTWIFSTCTARRAAPSAALRGSTDVRDFAGNYIDGYATPLRYLRYEGRNYVGLMKSTLGSMDNRATNLVTLKDIERASVDYYATVRTMYLERRARLIENRSVRTAELPDF